MTSDSHRLPHVKSLLLEIKAVGLLPKTHNLLDLEARTCLNGNWPVNSKLKIAIKDLDGNGQLLFYSFGTLMEFVIF